MLMARSANARNIVLATPAWLFMPTPTTLILATLSSLMMRLKPILSFAASSRSIERSRRSEEHTSELQSLMRISYAVFCLKKKKNNKERRNAKLLKQIMNHNDTYQYITSSQSSNTIYNN